MSRKPFKTREDYIMVSRPDHPDAGVNGMMLEHRLVAGEKLGRRLLPAEIVHHIDGDKSNNAPENLEVFPSRRAHMTYHQNERFKRVRQALQKITANQWLDAFNRHGKFAPVHPYFESLGLEPLAVGVASKLSALAFHHSYTESQPTHLDHYYIHIIIETVERNTVWTQTGVDKFIRINFKCAVDYRRTKQRAPPAATGTA